MRSCDCHVTVSRLYVDPSRVSEEVKEHLCVGEEGGVVICEYGAVWDDVGTLISKTEGKIWVSIAPFLCYLLNDVFCR